MEKKLNLKRLLAILRLGKASSQELKEISESLKEENNPEILSLIDQQWEGLAGKNISSLPDSLLNRIYEKAGIAEDHAGNSDKIRMIRHILQYAAVFALAFILSWFLKPDFSVPLANSRDNETKYFRIEVPNGSKSTISLPDSSKVILNSGSSLEYPDHFGETDRTVLLHGEAYFDVTRNKRKPFYVKTEEVTIKVLGTQFNVKSYPGENIVETILVSGSVEILPNVKVFDTRNQAYKRILLKPNEKAIFKHDSVVTSRVEEGLKKPLDNHFLKATIAFQEAGTTEKDIAWKNNVLIMNNEPFNEIIKKLERWYNVRITLEDEALGNIRFSARFSGESIAEVMHALSYTQPFQYEINKNQVTIKTNKR